MRNETLYPLIGLLILSICSSLIGLFFSKSASFKHALRLMIGSFFLGSTIAYLVHDTAWSNLIKKGLVIITSTFAKPIYDKVYNRIGNWLDKWITTKVNGGVNNREKINNNNNDTID